jgi:hypothetical protein
MGIATSKPMNCLYDSICKTFVAEKPRKLGNVEVDFWRLESALFFAAEVEGLLR